MGKIQNVRITNMCLIYKDDEILVQMRHKSDWPGLTLPGGHCEADENLDEAVKREIKEETGLDIYNPKLCGVEEFIHEKEDKYLVFFYKTNQFSGNLKESDEGEVFWIKRKDFKNYQLSDDIEEMLEVIENDDISELLYYKEDEKWKKKFI